MTTTGHGKVAAILVKAGLLGDEALQAARAALKPGETLAAAIVRTAGISEEAIAECVAKHYRMPYVRLAEAQIDAKAAALLTGEQARRFNAIPVAYEGDVSVLVATADPLAQGVRDALHFKGAHVKLALATDSSIRAAIEATYGAALAQDAAPSTARAGTVRMTATSGRTPAQTGGAAALGLGPAGGPPSGGLTPVPFPAASLRDAPTGTAGARALAGLGAQDQPQDVDRLAADAAKDATRGQLDLERQESRPIIKTLNAILCDAVEHGASDIHIEPGAQVVRVRERVDGVLNEVLKLPRWVQSVIVARLKVLGGLDIAERRVPQDGRFALRMGQRQIDLRLSTLPTHYGEKVVMRLIDGSRAQLGLEALGFEGPSLALVRETLAKPQGAFFVTGPTGSGKSSTLFASLRELMSRPINIVTVEDPIEYEVPGLNQVQVNEKAGLTFAATLRSILRQDPNVILVGEIRDRETAEIAARAAMTGHLVLSTLHTNDAPSAIARLYDLGIEPFLIASSLSLVLAQRLVRRSCEACRRPYAPPAEALSRLGLPAAGEYMQGAGCAKCNGSGYRGRIAVSELLSVDGRVRDMIAATASEDAFRKAMRESGLPSIGEDAAARVKRGLTTAEEVARVVEVEAKPQGASCAQCGEHLESNFAACPRCGTAVRASCRECKQPVKPSWTTCPFCRAPLDAAPATASGAPPGSATASGTFPAGGAPAAARQPAPTPPLGLALPPALAPAPSALSAADTASAAQIAAALAVAAAPIALAPAAAAAPPAPLPPLAPLDPALVGGDEVKVLVVEDDAELRRIMTMFLKRLRRKVTIRTASNGVEGLAAIAAEKPSLVILDYKMPGLDGLEVCRRLRADFATAVVPVLMMTAHAEEEVRAAAADAGVDEFIAKPVDARRLDERIEALLVRTYGA